MNIKIQCIRNATMKIHYAGKTFLTDPMFSKKDSFHGFIHNDKLANPTVELPIAIDELLKDVDGIVVSHSHIPAQGVPSESSDHFDSVAVKTIDKDMPIYVQPFDTTGIKKVGFHNVTTVTDTVTIDTIKITRFAGIHTDFEALLPFLGESSGYVFEAEGYPTILWTGDILLTNDIKEVIHKFNPDIIIAHTGGAHFPIDADGTLSKIVMDAEDAIELSKLTPKAKIIAVHMEALDHCTVKRTDLRKKVIAANIAEDRFFIPNDGDTLTF